MRTPEEPRPSRWRRRGLPKRRVISATLALAAGLLLAAGLSVAPARAAVTSSAAHTSARAIQPQTLSECYTGTNNAYEYYVWCNGKGPTSYRAIAYCTDGEVVFGIERWDGDNRESYASCESNGLDSTLEDNWGILLCSNDNGTGTYQGYYDRHGDISQYFQYWGSGTISTGATWACEYDTTGTPEVAPEQPQVSSAGISLKASS